jgi:hypothetical protein
MQNNGWDLISHPNTQAALMPDRPKKQQSQLMKDSQYYLKGRNFPGYKYMTVPKNALGPNTFDLAMKHYDLTMSFGASLNSLPLVKKDTLVSRFYADNSVRQVKKKIDYAAKLNQLAVPLFHGIGNKNGISKQDFIKILKHIKKKENAGEIQVVTPQILKKQGMLI